MMIQGSPGLSSFSWSYSSGPLMCGRMRSLITRSTVSAWLRKRVQRLDGVGGGNHLVAQGVEQGFQCHTRRGIVFHNQDGFACAFIFEHRIHRWILLGKGGMSHLGAASASAPQLSR